MRFSLDLCVCAVCVLWMLFDVFSEQIQAFKYGKSQEDLISTLRTAKYMISYANIRSNYNGMQCSILTNRWHTNDCIDEFHLHSYRLVRKSFPYFFDFLVYRCGFNSNYSIFIYSFNLSFAKQILPFSSFACNNNYLYHELEIWAKTDFASKTIFFLNCTMEQKRWKHSNECNWYEKWKIRAHWWWRVKDSQTKNLFALFFSNRFNHMYTKQTKWMKHTSTGNWQLATSRLFAQSFGFLGFLFFSWSMVLLSSAWYSYM